jgi:hypothetical protein
VSKRDRVSGLRTVVGLTMRNLRSFVYMKLEFVGRIKIFGSEEGLRCLNLRKD